MKPCRVTFFLGIHPACSVAMTQYIYVLGHYIFISSITGHYKCTSVKQCAANNDLEPNCCHFTFDPPSANDASECQCASLHLIGRFTFIDTLHQTTRLCLADLRYVVFVYDEIHQTKSFQSMQL